MTLRKYINISRKINEEFFIEFEYFHDLETYMNRLNYTYMPSWLHSDQYSVEKSFIQI